MLDHPSHHISYVIVLYVFYIEKIIAKPSVLFLRDFRLYTSKGVDFQFSTSFIVDIQIDCRDVNNEVFIGFVKNNIYAYK